MGSRPRAAMCLIAARASATQRPAWKDSSGGTTSRMWWGTARRSARDALAVPMSMPMYTCCESQLTTSPPRRCARARPSALLPEAVGPRMARKRVRPPPPALGTAEPPLDLGERHAQHHRPAVRAVGAQVHLVELPEQGQRL